VDPLEDDSAKLFDKVNLGLDSSSKMRVQNTSQKPSSKPSSQASSSNKAKFASLGEEDNLFIASQQK